MLLQKYKMFSDSTIPNNSPTGLSLIFLHISIIIISRKCVQTRFFLTGLIAEKIKLSLPHLFIFLYSCIFLFSSRPSLSSSPERFLFCGILRYLRILQSNKALYYDLMGIHTLSYCPPCFPKD